MKRFLLLLLSLAMVMGLLVACAPQNGGGESDSTVSDDAGSTEQVTDGETESSGEDIPTVISLADYRVIFPSDASVQLINAVDALCAELGWTHLDPTEDAAEVSPLEIIVGEADRQGVAEAMLDLRKDEYLIRHDAKTQQIFVLGSDMNQITLALDTLRDTLIDRNTQTLNLPVGGSYYSPSQYPLRQFTINGTSIREYTIVYPTGADLLTRSAALNIVDYFQTYMGVELACVTDATEESEYEILLGATNRAASKQTCTLADGQYVMFCDGKKLVMQGNNYMIGGGFGMLVREYVDLQKRDAHVEVQNLPTAPVAKDFVFSDAFTNAILMIGDGMGCNHIAMAEKQAMGTFAASYLPSIGTAITASQSVLIGQEGYTDSAAAATALACGYKTMNYRIGINTAGNSVVNLREIAQVQGAKTAVLTTDLITGATPGGFLCHVMDRNNTTEISRQINALITAGKVDYCEGDVGDGLLTHTRTALSTISAGGSNFFAMIEEAMIDKNSHNGDMTNAYAAVVRFNQSIAYAIEFTLCHPGTVLIVTADHETGGLTPATSLSDLNGILSPEYQQSHASRLSSDMNTYGYAFTTYNSLNSNGCNHSNANVPVYALGPGTEIFNGVATDNILIAKFIAKAYGFDHFGQ